MRALLLIVCSAGASCCERNSTITGSNSAEPTPRAAATISTPDTISKSALAVNTNRRPSGFLDSEERTHAARVTYIAVTIRPANKRTVELSPQDLSEVVRAIFANAVAVKINAPATSDAKDQDIAGNGNGWEYLIEKQVDGTVLTFYAKKMT